MAKMSQAGGARMERGVFRVYLKAGNSRKYLTDQSLREYIREYWNFLMSEFETVKIGQRMARKGRSANGFITVSFPFLGFNVKLFKIKDGFATFVLEMPFEGEGSDDEPQSEGSNEYDESYGEMVEQGADY